MNYGLIALLARALPNAEAFQIERAAKKFERLSRSHAMLCERICPDTATAGRKLDRDRLLDLAAIEVQITDACVPWNLQANFQHDSRGFTVLLSGNPGEVTL